MPSPADVSIAARPADLWEVPPTLPRLSGSLDFLIVRGVAGRERGNVIALHLRPDEAAEGGTAAISIPLDVRCPDCTSNQRAACGRCGGSGIWREQFDAWLTVPRHVTDGAILAASVELPDAIAVVRFRALIDVPA